MMCQRKRAGSVPAARRGITIIEVMVVMSGVAVMLGLCALTLQLLLRLNADSQARLSAAAALDRLAGQFRQDVHACNAAGLDDKPGGATASPSLRLNLGPSRTVSYEARDGRVVRSESESGKSTRHESYTLARMSSVQFQVRDEAARRFVALVVTRSTGKNAIDPPRPLEVLALLGKNRPEPLQQRGSAGP
jgi:hypothetical protein